MLAYPLRRRRRGLSLTEVLMAIFVMAIGLLSLLVLFPVGLSNLKWAVQDDRIAMASANAVALAEVPRIDPTGVNYTLRSDPLYDRALRSVPASLDPRLSLIFDFAFPIPPPKFDPNGMGPPVFVDPIGAKLWPNGALGLGLSVGFTENIPLLAPRSSLGIPRTTTSLTPTGAAQRWCTMEDDIDFGPNGLPTGPVVTRERRYSWAYMCRWPKYSDRSVVDVSIIIFNGRLINNTAGFNTVPGETSLINGVTGLSAGKVFTKGSTVVNMRLDWRNGAANVAKPVPFRKGDWILDNTLILPLAIPGVGYGQILDIWENLPVGIPRYNGLAGGHFYRVVSVSDIQYYTGVPYQTLEIDRPAKADGFVAVYLNGVVEVIEKNNGRMPMQ